MGTVSQFRPVSFGENKPEHHHNHEHATMGPNDQLLALINGIAQDLNAYNQKVATITHQEHLLKK